MRLNRVRRFLIAGGALLASATCRAFGTERVYRLGIMINEGPEESAAFRKDIEGFLSKRGFVSGRNLRIEYVYTGGGDGSAGSLELIRQRARELVAMKPDVIYADTSERAKALKAQTKTIPIVFSVGGDPVASGLVRDLARPGGNLTGSSRFFGEMLHKQLELTRELLPRAKRAAFVADYPQMASLMPGFPEAYEATATRLGITLLHGDTSRHGHDLEATLRALVPSRPEALIALPPFLGPSQAPFKILRDFEKQHRIPVIHQHAAGTVLSYGSNWGGSVTAALEIVMRILNGADPATIPVQRPTRVVLTIDRSAARAIDLPIPQSILLRADRVIE